ncbi:MAG: efflux transporter periplasmic adaptor subunit [Piscirickettsiaceae bacterium]|nr:MAG: efflux transporter periplasmic adaptor subunit [Piscirickettsiaceae bacterium]
MTKKIVLLVCLIVVIFGALFGTKFIQLNNAMSSRKPPPPPLVTTTKVTEERWESILSTVGTVNPVLGVIISNELAGIVSVLHVESGQTVHKGDLLIELDTSTDRANLKGLIAAEKLAQIKFDRQVKLLKNRATSKSSHDQAHAELDIARAGVLAQKSIINKKKIRAPFSGKLGIRQVSLGQYLDKGTEIIPLVSLTATIADFAFSERHFAKLKVNQEVRIQVNAYPGEVFKGKIQAINPGLHQDTRTIAVRAVIANPDEKLRAGMFADVSVITSQPRSVLTLPETAVLYNTYGENVYLVQKKDGKDTVKQHTIKTAERRHGRIVVTDGLKLDDTVVDEGHIKLRNGMAISIAKHNKN